VSGYGCCDLSATGANASLEYLQSYFPGVRLITCRTNHPWPAHSPDLSFLDYFMWEYLKDRIYVNNPQTMMEIMRIPHEMLDTVICASSHSDSAPRSLDRAHYKLNCAVLAKRWLTKKKKRAPHKLQMSVKQAYENKLLGIPLSTKFYLIKNGYTFLGQPAQHCIK